MKSLFSATRASGSCVGAASAADPHVSAPSPDNVVKFTEKPGIPPPENPHDFGM
jgi:hypothetical protein